MIQVLQKHAVYTPNKQFLGTRVKNSDGKVGNYTWKTYSEVWQLSQKIAKGIQVLELANVEDWDQDWYENWSCIGIWSLNRWEVNAVSFAA